MDSRHRTPNPEPAKEIEVRRLLALLFEVNQLKRIPRMGWLVRGVGPADTESVAEHTYGMALTALLLAEMVGEPVDRGRLLTMCLLHDLPETQILDLVPAAIHYLTPVAKRRAEEAALADLLAGLPAAEEFQALWQEFEEGTTVEGRLARDADRLELIIQAAAYERAGWRQLDEFWQEMKKHRWEFPVSAAVFRGLVAEREGQEQDAVAGGQVSGVRK